MLEEHVKRIADALEKIAEALGSLEIEVPAAQTAAKAEKKAAATKTAPAEAEKETAPPAEEKPAEDGGKAPDLDTVVKALQAYMQANGRDAAVELLGKYGAKRASDIAEDKRAAFVKEAS